MNDAFRRKMDKIDREQAFFADNAADFAGNAQVAKYSPLIAAEKTKILAFDAQQTSGFDDQRQAQEIYENRRDELVDLLQLHVLAASIVDDDIEGTAAKFKMPKPRSDQALIAKAASFNADAAPIKDALAAAGLPAGATAALLTTSTAFQQAALAHDSAEENHAEATGGLSASFRLLMDYSRKRGKNVLMKYRDNSAKLAAWTVASHLDRAPKSKPIPPAPTT